MKAIIMYDLGLLLQIQFHIAVAVTSGTDHHGAAHTGYHDAEYRHRTDQLHQRKTLMIFSQSVPPIQHNIHQLSRFNTYSTVTFPVSGIRFIVCLYPEEEYVPLNISILVHTRPDSSPTSAPLSLAKAIISNKPVQECTKKIEIALNRNRTNSMGKKKAWLEFYIKDGRVTVLEHTLSGRAGATPLDTETTIGDRDVNLRFTYSDGSVVLLDGTHRRIAFARDSGALVGARSLSNPQSPS